MNFTQHNKIFDMSLFDNFTHIKIAIATDRGGMIRSARDSRNDLPGQRICKTRDVLPSIVSVSEATVVSSAPFFSFWREKGIYGADIGYTRVSRVAK